MTLQKTGGRKSSNVVDWAQLPAFLLESVEILPGPHSALYDGKSIGGVLNMKTKTPKEYRTRVPQLTYTTGYRSYDTFSNTAVIQGGVEKFIYDIAYQNYMIDGYLRNSETETNIGFGRLGFILPGDGYITFSASLSDIDLNSPEVSTLPSFLMKVWTTVKQSEFAKKAHLSSINSALFPMWT